MNRPGDEAVTAEVEKRLDDIFGSDEDDHPAFLENGPLSQNSPLRNLKGIVLSIDWEITDDIMGSFLEEIGRLKEVFADDKIPVLFLQLLGSVGKYIRNQKARAHPDSIRILNSVYNSFEKVLIAEDMPEAEKRKWLHAEVNRFKKLKEDIARGRAEPYRPSSETETPSVSAGEIPGAPIAPEPGPTGQEPGGMLPHEAFAYAVEEIKQVIKAEFQALRAELRLWREGR